MKKATFSFRALRAGSYLYRFFLSKVNRRRLQNASVGIAASLAISAMASAQCNTFRNADAANPILSVLDPARRVAGFAFADIDGDGDQDVYVSYEINTYPPSRDVLHLFRNVGSKEHPVFKEDPNTGFGNKKVAYQNPFMQFVDIDGDGDLDYYASEDALDYYDFGAISFCENIGTTTTPRFKIGGDDPTPYISSHVYQPFAFADVDGDGDYDLYIADESNGYGFSYYQRIYYNSGTKKKGLFNLDDYFLNTIDENTSRTYYDWNKDGLLDFFGVAYRGGTYIKNVGSIKNPRYINASGEGPDFKLVSPYRMIDLNNDGAPEVFDFGVHYSILAPVAVIKDSLLANGNKALYSLNRAKAYTYRWELNGKTLAGATSYYIVPKKPGTYTLYVTGPCGTGVSLNYEFAKTNFAPAIADNRIASPASINGISARVYPNPFANTVNLQLTGKPCTVKVVDLAGRVLVSQTTTATSLQIGGTLTAGTYLVQVWEGKEMVYGATVVKQ